MLRRALGGRLGFNTFRPDHARVTRARWLVGLAVAFVAMSGCSGSARLSFSGDTSVVKSSQLGEARYRPEVCQEFDLTPESRPLSIDAVKEHLAKKALSYKVRVERPDLHIFDVLVDQKTVELRVATLDNQLAAGRHLHVALLQHGNGFWGVHRGNLAVLGPPGPVDEVLAFGAVTGLACFGVFTVAGRDDTFVVPGGYFEF